MPQPNPPKVPAPATHEAVLELGLEPCVYLRPGRRQISLEGEPATIHLIAYYQQTDAGCSGYFDHVSGAAEPPSGPEYDLLELYIYNWDAREWRTFTTLDHKFLDAMFGPGTTDGLYEELENHLTTIS